MVCFILCVKETNEVNAWRRRERKLVVLDVEGPCCCTSICASGCYATDVAMQLECSYGLNYHKQLWNIRSKHGRKNACVKWWQVSLITVLWFLFKASQVHPPLDPTALPAHHTWKLVVLDVEGPCCCTSICAFGCYATDVATQLVCSYGNNQLWNIRSKRIEEKRLCEVICKNVYNCDCVYIYVCVYVCISKITKSSL